MTTSSGRIGSHRSLPHPATPATARAARPKAAPGDRASDRHQRVRIDRVNAHGKLTLRHSGRLHHIGTGGRACPAAAGLGQQGVNVGQAPALCSRLQCREEGDDRCR